MGETDSDALCAKISRAIADPASILPRNNNEGLSSWVARAVMSTVGPIADEHEEYAAALAEMAVELNGQQMPGETLVATVLRIRTERDGLHSIIHDSDSLLKLTELAACHEFQNSIGAILGMDHDWDADSRRALIDGVDSLLAERNKAQTERDRLAADLTLAVAEAEDARNGGLDLIAEFTEIKAQWESMRERLSESERLVEARTEERDVHRQRGIDAAGQYTREMAALTAERDELAWQVEDRRIERDSAHARSARYWLAWQSARRLVAEFGTRLPWFPAMIGAYEQQELPEARFVRALDKVMPKIVHLLDGCTGLIEQGMGPSELAVMLVRQRADIARYAGEFGALLDLHAELGARVVTLLAERAASEVEEVGT